MNEKFCPCCGRHCSLDNPHCGRGEEFIRTGVIPTDKAREGFEGRPHGDEHRVKYHELDINSKLVLNIRGLGHMLHRMSDGRASQNRILDILNECKSITQSELTEQLGIQPGSASEVLGKLEKAGLIMRTSNEKDRRTCEIRLTEEGVERAKEANEFKHIRNGELFSSLSEPEKQTLLELLEKINPHSKMHSAHFHHHGGGHGHHHDGHIGSRHTDE